MTSNEFFGAIFVLKIFVAYFGLSILHLAIFNTKMKRRLFLLAILCSFNTASFAQEERSHDEFISVESEPIPLRPIQRFVVYPEKAKMKGLEGTVVISALIDKDGTVLKTEVDKSSNPIFAESARDAVMKTKFIPAKQNGLPVKLWYTIPIIFSLTPRTVPMISIDTTGAWAVNYARDRMEYEKRNPTKPHLIGDVRSILPYPDELRKLNITGRVRFAVVLDTGGAITGHHIEYSDDPFLEEPVKNAIAKMKFEKPPTPASFSYEISFAGDSVRMW